MSVVASAKQLMKKSPLLIGFVICCWVSVALGQSVRRDGNWWHDQDAIGKKFYLGGVFDGLANAKEMRQLLGAPAKDKWDIQPALIQAFANRRGEQLVDGVDVFYENFANRSIPVPEALFAVCALASGAPAEEMKKIIEAMRLRSSVIVPHSTTR